MGLIRKTLSIGTLGAVSFRSKKEKLRRAETSLEHERAGRLAAEARITNAEKRVRRAQAEAERAGKRLDKRKQRRHRTSEHVAEALAGVGPAVRSGIESTHGTRVEVAERSRRAGRRAGKAAKRSLGQAKEAASAAKDAAAPHAASAVARAEEMIDHLTSHDT